MCSSDLFPSHDNPLLTWLDNEYIPYVEDNADDGVRICLFIEEIIEEINSGIFDLKEE